MAGAEPEVAAAEDVVGAEAEAEAEAGAEGEVAAAEAVLNAGTRAEAIGQERPRP